VQHVAEAENWLKAPFEGGTAVLVFLDPHAGQRVDRRLDGGPYELETLGPETELLHGSELPTEIYRRTCGFLTYHADLGAGTASVEGALQRRVRLPEPGVVHDGRLVPLPEAVRALACRLGPLLHGTFRRPHDAGAARRFRFAVERLPRLEGAPAAHPLLERIETWSRRRRDEDEAGFTAWLARHSGETPDPLDEAGRWRRYVEWRDTDECTALHRDQDAAFGRSGIPDEIVRLHEAALQQLRHAASRMLRVVDGLGA
jgi:hypothetical protein